MIQCPPPRQDAGGGGLGQTVRNVLLELLALSPLAHPRIVLFKGMLLRFPPPPAAGGAGGAEGFELGLVFEFCDGGSLHRRLFQGGGGTAGGLAYGERVRIGREIAEGMAYVHGVGILHRDLRPAPVWTGGRALQRSRPPARMARMGERDGADRGES